MQIRRFVPAGLFSALGNAAAVGRKHAFYGGIFVLHGFSGGGLHRGVAAFALPAYAFIYLAVLGIAQIIAVMAVFAHVFKGVCAGQYCLRAQRVYRE